MHLYASADGGVHFLCHGSELSGRLIEKYPSERCFDKKKPPNIRFNRTYRLNAETMISLNYRSLNLCSWILIISFLSSTATYCSNLTSFDDKDTACFLEPPETNPVLLHTSGNSLVLPCHVARSKRSTIEWWYTDLQKSINIKIYPVYPAVRPTVLRFVTSLTPYSKDSNETDIIDASVLLRHVNVDDSGIYRCVIRSGTMEPFDQMEDVLESDDANAAALSYQVQISAPRLCQLSHGSMPCFTAMRTSSPTVIDAYQTAFLQCVIKTYDRPVTVFWVVGDASINSVLITDYLTTNQYHGDRLRRVFPLSPFDYSIELSVNRTNTERVYSCVIDGASEIETTLFTYIVRAINLDEVDTKVSNSTHHHVHKLPAHDTLNLQQILSLRESKKAEEVEEKEEQASNEENSHEDHASESEHENKSHEEHSHETSTVV